MSRNKYWIIFYISKIVYMFFAIFVYSKFTMLGDTDSYIYSSYTLNYPMNSTHIIGYFASRIHTYFGTIFTHIVFLSLSFYGIYYSVSRLRLSNKELLYIFLLLSLPSFGVWTSIVSKESIGVLYMGIILGYFIDLMENKKRKIKFIEYFALCLLYIFKIQYFSAILSLWIFIKVSNVLSLKSNGKSLFLFIYILITISFFYYFRDYINDISFKMPEHFSLNGGSTRENIFWIKDYDVFFNAPYGMFIAFWGPTLSEVINKPIQGIVFMESFVIFTLFVCFLYRALLLTIETKKINIFYLSILLIVLFWLLFVHYPFGVLNPGSALRYRENFYAFLVVFIFYLYQKIKLRCQVEKNSNIY